MSFPVQTPWGAVVRDEEGDLFLGDRLVLFVEEDGGHAVVLAGERGGEYVARWVDENGEPNEASYRGLAAAVRKATESWGR